MQRRLNVTFVLRRMTDLEESVPQGKFVDSSSHFDQLGYHTAAGVTCHAGQPRFT